MAAGAYYGEVDATNNWWGAASGPSYNGDGPGTGDKITDPGFVGLFAPFLTNGSVCPPIILTLSPSTVIGGNTSKATVMLNSAAPAGGAVVTLASSDTGMAKVPASVTVAAGATSKTFNVTTMAVATPSSPTISATYSGTTFSALLNVNPAVLTSFTVNPVSVIGGKNSKGTITLNGKAPIGGAVVRLSSDNPAATVPATVTIPAGGNSAAFNITTTPVADTQGPFLIRASYNSVTVLAALTVQQATASKLTVAPNNVMGGVSSTGTVTLTGNAPAGGAVVTLISADHAATFPGGNTVTVQEGFSSATFAIDTTQVPTKQGPFNIFATYNGVTVTAPLTVQAAALSKLTVSPDSVTGGTSATGTVTLTGEAPAGGAVVTLVSGDGAATFPDGDTVTIPEGTSSATFAINTTPVATKRGPFNISASYNGVTKNDSLTVKAPAVFLLVLDPTTVVGGNPSTGTVTLTGPVPSRVEITVTLKSSNTAAATVPPSVTVLPGETTATFDITTLTATRNTNVNISAAAGGVTKTATLAVMTPTVF